MSNPKHLNDLTDGTTVVFKHDDPAFKEHRARFQRRKNPDLKLVESPSASLPTEIRERIATLRNDRKRLWLTRMKRMVLIFLLTCVLTVSAIYVILTYNLDKRLKDQARSLMASLSHEKKFAASVIPADKTVTEAKASLKLPAVEKTVLSDSPDNSIAPANPPQQAVANNIEEPAEITVSAADPSTQQGANTKTAAAIIAARQAEKPESEFNLMQQIEKISIDTSGRQFVYYDTPRSAARGEYLFDENSATAKKPRSRTSKLGLKPVPGEEGRFVGGDGLQWQSNWELNNPEGNIRRARSYLDYVKENFNSNARKGFKIRELDKVKVTPKLLGEAAKAPVSVIRHTR
ncbi:MAG: hypothetical protein D6719_04120 [Candidatus Dadabacteria bacterium]|nr:MAG: hypothetical protein D6719_04120 [Candidatus Dadabacteria bacterium]